VNESQGEWRPDPSGRYEFRYWDGTKWTERVAGSPPPVQEPSRGTVSVVAERAVAPTVQGEWRPDPSGHHQFRYWDGTRWTGYVSDQGQQATELYDGTVATAGVSATSPGVQGAAPPTVVVKKGHGCLWALLVVAVLVVAGVVLFGLAVNNAVESLNAEQAKHAITKTQFDAVQLGISHTALESQLGMPPEDTQEFVTKGVLSQQDLTSSCVYYNQAGQSFGSRFQFCFDGDSLRSKNAY